jgi:RHS repeat-associated protein
MNWSSNSAQNPNTWSTPAGIQYVYSANQNNGQITQAVESWSGRNISYQYDALKRLISAASTPIAGGAPTAWTETMQYDGFGNLTAKVLNGATTSIPVNGATNQLSNAGYDANGNMISGAGATLGYDEANRIVSATEYSGGTEYYAYAPDGKRMFRMEADGVTQEWTFWGARGEKLGTFAMVYNEYVGNDSHPYQMVLNPTLSFAGKTIWDGGKPLVQDRIGTNRATGARYYPFGDEITSTANDAVKFGTYHRDGFTGLDYADQRYYASLYGRFNSPDPATSSIDPQNPATWHRYSYVFNDSVNLRDPNGLDPCSGGEGGDDGCTCDPCGPCGVGTEVVRRPDLFGGLAGSNASCVGDPGPPPGPDPTAQPECKLTAYERGLDAFGGVNVLGAAHTYLVFTDQNGVTTYFEGQDQGGSLKAVGSRYSGGSGGYLSSDKPSSDTPLGVEAGASICDLFKTLQGDVTKIDALKNVRYNKYGPNSNSVFHYFLQSLPSSGWVNVPFFLQGYNTAIPGLK